MAGILTGLSSLGLDNLENTNIFGEDVKTEQQKAEEAVKAPEEKDYLIDKTYECVVCSASFSNKIIKTGKAKLIGTDLDLRPRYNVVDMTKYDVVVCPTCGYASLTRFWGNLSDKQIRLIKDNISQKVRFWEPKGGTYTYAEALERYKLALASAVVKNTKVSEKAYICLKAAWVLRGQAENLPEDTLARAKKLKDIEEEENSFLRNAYDGFTAARAKEIPPYCGMDNFTVDYLLAVLALRFQDYEVSSRLISGLLASTAAERMKDKARDLKELLKQDMKKNNK